MKPKNKGDEQNWPFEAWLKLAVRGYGLSPDAFWQMSLRDWLSLTKPDRVPSLSAQDLSVLIKQFPDEVKHDDTD